MKCMKHIVYLAVVLLFMLSYVAINGCGGDDDEPAAAGDYWPCAIGNLWDYVVTMTVDTGDTTMSVTGSITLKIVGDTVLINGQYVFMQEYVVTMSGSVDRDTYYIADTDTSILRFSSVYDTIPDVMLEFPLETGNNWIVSGYQTAAVLGRKNISVPAGTYNCYEVAYAAYGDTVYDYFAANTGIVKEYMSDTESGMTLIVEVELEVAIIN
ncbi:MAG: hypothetical protein JSV53_11225 [candidate division WOR-3 bacterium]|nr:MAG: hypothetical protein JSV53_11225 [candidate division WOR-3 bacterium]